MSVATTAEQLCQWTRGTLLCGDPGRVFRSTVIDSRVAGRDDLFVAILGPTHDAHRFVNDVLAKDVAGVLVQSDRVEAPLGRSNAFVVEVDDTTKALADLARGHRQGFEGPLIAITGSNGKTTTKELCAGILEGLGPTLATRGNLNNQFGVPLSLLRRSEADLYAVIEMGMNHRGEIATLAAIAEPTIGILTNVGSAHIEFLGSREAIAEEKGDLLASLPTTGIAVVARDDATCFAQARRTRARVLGFGRQVGADLLASGVRKTDGATFTFMLESPFGRGEIRVSGLSETIVDNALAAAGGAFAAGASFEIVAQGLARHAGVPGRMQPRPLPGDLLVIDDSYNANPQSMRNALETLARLETKGQRIAVLGQMGELGDEREAAHRETGRLAAALGLDALFLIGPMAEVVAEAAREVGFENDRIRIAWNHEALTKELRSRIGPGDVVLVKGSRAASMERIVRSLDIEEESP